jgi:RimJ/RimL family protein N-acetyltransferase
VKLRRFTRDDLDVLAAMIADEEQMEFYPGPRTRAEALAWIERNLELYAACGKGILLVEGDDGAFLGYCGFRPLSLDGVEETEIGWHIHKSAWGRGVATEAARMAMDLAAERFGVTRMVAIIPVEHRASRRVAGKLGMRHERDTVYEDEPCAVYSAEMSARPAARPEKMQPPRNVPSSER